MSKYERDSVPESTENNESKGFLAKLKKNAIKIGIIAGIGALILAAL